MSPALQDPARTKWGQVQFLLVLETKLRAPRLVASDRHDSSPRIGMRRRPGASTSLRACPEFDEGINSGRAQSASWDQRWPRGKAGCLRTAPQLAVVGGHGDRFAEHLAPQQSGGEMYCVVSAQAVLPRKRCRAGHERLA